MQMHKLHSCTPDCVLIYRDTVSHADAAASTLTQRWKVVNH